MVRGEYILIGVGTAVVLYFGGSYLMKLRRLSNELETVAKVTIHKVTLGGIELSIAATLKNPTAGSIRLKHPYIKLVYGGKTIASSEIRDVEIEIKKFSQVVLPPIRINLVFMDLIFTVPALVKEYREAGKINLEVQTITTINGSLPYKKTDKITLGGGKAA